MLLGFFGKPDQGRNRPCLSRKFIKAGPDVPKKSFLCEKIPGRVSAKHEFGENHQIRSLSYELFIGINGKTKVALQVAHRRIQLSDSDSHLIAIVEKLIIRKDSLCQFPKKKRTRRRDHPSFSLRVLRGGRICLVICYPSFRSNFRVRWNWKAIRAVLSP